MYVEDHDLYAAHYHIGGPGTKIWYVIPANYSLLLEDWATQAGILCGTFQPVDTDGTNKPVLPNWAYFKGKTVTIPPSRILEQGIRVVRAAQRAGQLVLTAPRAYHEGLNTGFIRSEAINFALADWLEYGGTKYISTSIHPASNPHDRMRDLILSAVFVEEMNKVNRAWRNLPLLTDDASGSKKKQKRQK